MKLRNCSLACCTLLLLGTATFLGGCATTGVDRSVKASNSIQNEDQEIRKLIVQIDLTGSSLDTLMVANAPDLKKPFDAYTKNLAKLEKEGKHTIKRMDEMRERNKEYFAEWEKQGDTYTDPEIRALSNERRSHLAAIYARIPEAGMGIKGAYHAYLTDLQEIHRFLSTDLTPKGLDAIAPVANKTIQDREALKISFGPLLAALDAARAEMYSGKK
jgi:phosphotransacetylase